MKFHATVKIKSEETLQLEEAFRATMWKYLSCDCALEAENPRCKNGFHVSGPFESPMTSYDMQQA